MRNKINGIIREVDDELLFFLYELSNSFNHHHRVVWNQPLDASEIPDLIKDLETITVRLKEWQMYAKKDMDYEHE